MRTNQRATMLFMQAFPGSGKVIKCRHASCAATTAASLCSTKPLTAANLSGNANRDNSPRCAPHVAGALIGGIASDVAAVFGSELTGDVLLSTATTPFDAGKVKRCPRSS